MNSRLQNNKDGCYICKSADECENVWRWAGAQPRIEAPQSLRLRLCDTPGDNSLAPLALRIAMQADGTNSIFQSLAFLLAFFGGATGHRRVRGYGLVREKSGPACSPSYPRTLRHAFVSPPCIQVTGGRDELVLVIKVGHQPCQEQCIPSIYSRESDKTLKPYQH